MAIKDQSLNEMAFARLQRLINSPAKDDTSDDLYKLMTRPRRYRVREVDADEARNPPTLRLVKDE